MGTNPQWLGEDEYLSKSRLSAFYSSLLSERCPSLWGPILCDADSFVEER